MMPLSVTYDKDLKAWTNPYFMAPMNAKVVRRTNALLDYPYGRDFSYAETAMTTGGLGGWWAAMRYALFRPGLPDRHGDPGHPPAAEAPCAAEIRRGPVRRNARERILRTDPGRGDAGRHDPESPHHGAGRSGDRIDQQDAGRGRLCLAEDADRIGVGGGFWTPASALGPLLRDRVSEHAGLKFELL
jgi:short subunit dehydrogenase-like uncharacterized protein